jgi:hypothetical protein
MKKLLLGFAVFGILLSACKKDKEEDVIKDDPTPTEEPRLIF